MLGYESLTAPADPAARPRLEPDAGRLGAPPRQGDFAAGLRTRPRGADVFESFATGMCSPRPPATPPPGDFARGIRSQAATRATGNFATGQREPHAESARPNAVDRSRSDRQRREIQRAAA
jgi:hypothetical protein